MANGISIKIDPHKMLSVAGIIQAETAKIKQCYDSIAAQGRSAKKYWEGECADIFCGAIEQLDEQANWIKGKLDKYYADLTIMANTYISAEESAKSEVATLSTDVF